MAYMKNHILDEDSGIQIIDPTKREPDPGIEYYSVPRAAAKYSCSISFIWSEIRRGHIKARRVGAKRVFIHADDLDNWFLLQSVPYEVRDQMRKNMEQMDKERSEEK